MLDCETLPRLLGRPDFFWRHFSLASREQTFSACLLWPVCTEKPVAAYCYNYCNICFCLAITLGLALESDEEALRLALASRVRLMSFRSDLVRR